MGYGTLLLSVVRRADPSTAMTARRMSAAIALKNLIKRRWRDEPPAAAAAAEASNGPAAPSFGQFRTRLPNQSTLDS